MDIAAVIGNTAAVFTTAAFFPQVIKVARTRHVADLSLPMYVVFSFGVFCWFIYGILINSVPVIAANGITFLSSIYIMSMIIRYGGEKGSGRGMAHKGR
jgi:MtN3 and saliva related transmembrane protein